VQALDRPIETVERRLVTELAQRLRNFLLDFLLVERARQRRLLSRRRFLFRLLPPIVEDYDVQSTLARAL
jgi:hypothetical protein